MWEVSGCRNSWRKPVDLGCRGQTVYREVIVTFIWILLKILVFTFKYANIVLSLLLYTSNIAVHNIVCFKDVSRKKFMLLVCDDVDLVPLQTETRERVHCVWDGVASLRGPDRLHWHRGLPRAPGRRVVLVAILFLYCSKHQGQSSLQILAFFFPIILCQK